MSGSFTFGYKAVSVGVNSCCTKCKYLEPVMFTFLGGWVWLLHPFHEAQYLQFCLCTFPLRKNYYNRIIFPRRIVLEDLNLLLIILKSMLLYKAEIYVYVKHLSTAVWLKFISKAIWPELECGFSSTSNMSSSVSAFIAWRPALGKLCTCPCSLYLLMILLTVDHVIGGRSW